MLCGCSDPDASSIDNPEVQTAPTMTSSSIEPSTPQQSPSAAAQILRPSSTPKPTLSSAGPWLLLRIGEELFVSNDDGSAVLHHDLSDLWTDWSNAFISSQDRGMVAVKDMNGELFILDLPEVTINRVSHLFNPDIDIPNDQYSFWEDAYASIYFAPNMAWSSSGDRLAFVGMIEGMTPDLYLFDLETNKITRLTSGETIAHAPEWSPTDDYIVHDAVSGMYWGSSGRGYSIQSLWVAFPDGSTPFRLFESELAPHKGFEHRLGWLSDTVYIASTEPEWCNQTSLRTVSVTGAPSVPLWDGSFFDAVFDPQSKTVLLFIPLEEYQWNNPGCPRSESPGFYLLNLETGTKSVVEGFDLERFSNPTISWSSDASLFIIENDKHVYTINPGGEVGYISSNQLGNPHISRDGQYWVMLDLDQYPNSGIVLMIEEGHFKDIFTEEVGSISWSPDSTHLFFTGKSSLDNDYFDLYVASSPTFIPENLSAKFALPDDWRMSFLTWVSP
jgi:hypothetical protein